ncbi:hypothetical protein PX699_16730 [Sphingobium sp. H39-3-25]|uniref:hypothetical protein n=1 Tax=Sphingomonadales TaxID=204457 RepID=UPI00082EEC13|nr:MULTISPECIES: hypothetical protein [Sphingomonadaceae]MDF0491566.1 hypothetical protein [Sphingomonas pollutisoli]MDF0543999.1 hypothetical protein [Sphingobium arseniciresistens]
MTIPIRIKATGSLGHIAYVHRSGGGSFSCTLANGTPAAFSYAGITTDEMACRFELNDCASGQEALAIVKRHGSAGYTYELFASARFGPSEPIGALAALEAEVQRLKALIPSVFEQVDNRAVDRARALLAGYVPDPAPTPNTSGALYLRLWHGRRDPAENLDDWGSEGPVIGPLAFVQTTYMCDVKFAAAPEVMDRFFPAVMADWRQQGFSNVHGPVCDWRFTIADDLIEYDGVFYGDWSVFVSSPADVAREAVSTNGPPAPNAQ